MNRGLKKFGITILSIILVLNSLAFSAFATDVEIASISPDVSWFDVNESTDSYTITTAAQLLGLYQILQDEDFEYCYDFANVTIKLGADIILNDVTAENWTANAVEWKSMSGSDATNFFAGTFDGNGHSIIGLYSTDGGLFASVSGATIQNLKIDSAVINTTNNQVGAVVGSATVASAIENCEVKNSTIEGRSDVGGIAGSSSSATITACHVINTEISGTSSVGGISGTSGTISDCTVDGDCTVSGGTYVGGITGDIKKSITNCTNSATVSGTNCLGGIAGLYSGGTSVELTGCTNNGSVGSDDANFVGGILGSTTSHGLKISECVNNAPISGDTNVAGIAGMIYTSTAISDCESNGSVEGTKNVAGIVGNSSLGGNTYEAGKPNSITGCTVSAEISGSENVGGLVGSNAVVEDNEKDDTAIQNNILTPSSSVNGTTSVGALIGNNGTNTDTGTIKNNFWPEAAGTASGAGAGSSDTDAESTIMTTNSAYDEDGNLSTTITTGEDGKTITNLSEAIKEIIGSTDVPDVLKVTATFNNGGHGTAPAAQEVVIGTKINLPSMENDGYWTFLNWTADGTTYAAGDEYTVTKDVTFTANWRNDRPSTGGTTTYTVTAPSNVDNGSVSVSPKNASKGTTVTITVTPDDGYELDTLTVTDASGNKLTLTDKGDGKYTFTMPASKVTVEATFVEEETPITVPTFVDVPSDAYYADAVEWAVKNGITLGTSDTTFSPNLGCTRAQVVTFLWRAAGCPEPKGNSSSFTDVGNDLYYSKAVLWAVENGITLGTSDTTFSPDEICSRAQIVTFLWRNENRPGASTSNSFVDVTNSAYYADAVEWAAENEITLGTSATTFSPNDDCTRAQIVTFLYRTYAD